MAASACMERGASPSDERDVRSRFLDLLAEHRRLTLDFLEAELNLLYTIAAFADEHASARLRRACTKLNSQGCDLLWTKLLALPPAGEPEESLHIRLEQIRTALMRLQSGATQNDGEPLGAPAAESPQLLQASASHAASGGPTRRTDGLTARETEVLKSIAEGRSSKQVATSLGITFKTAACHRYRIMQKLGAHDTATLVRYAIREGLIQA